MASPPLSLFLITQADRIFIAQPLWSRVANCYHCFGFGPLYFYLALGFLYRWNSIRLVGIATGAAKLYAGAVRFIFLSFYVPCSQLRAQSKHCRKS